MKILGTECVPSRPTQIKQITLACYACLCFTTADYLLQGNEKRSNIACLPIETICHRLIRENLLSFPYFSRLIFCRITVQCESKSRAAWGNIECGCKGFVFFLELSCVDPRFPTGEKQLETETLLEKLFVVL